MSRKINPYYNPEKLELELYSLGEPGLSYEYNTLCFWATTDGKIYTASDSGCSCPTPFENYEVENQKEALKLLERVGSVSQAEAICDGWGKDYKGKSFLTQDETMNLSCWVKSKLKL